MAYQPQPYYNGGYYQQYQSGAAPDMLNQYKANYQQPQIPIQQQMIQQPVQPLQMPPPQMSGTSDMIWVLSEVEAQSYPVAPNNSVILWDKNNDVVYIKSVNAQGVPSMRVLDYKERTCDTAPKNAEKHECQCGNRFVIKEDFKTLQEEFYALRSEFDDYKSKSKTKSTKKIIEEVENDG